MYRTKLYWPDKYETVSNLKLASRPSSSSSYSAEISYSDQAITTGGITRLVGATVNVFTSLSAFNALKGKYILLDDVVYRIPANASMQQLSPTTGDAYIRASVAWKISQAELTLFSGSGMENAIHSCNITWSSNSAEDLTMGSVCAAMLECKIITSGSGFGIDAGSQFQAYKVAEDGTETQIGVFNVETPTRLTAHTYKIQAYDNVRKLDKDLAEWFNGLDGWPYKAKTLAEMVAEQCGLTISAFDAPSYDDLDVDGYYVYRFTVNSGTTGRQLMSWICEALCNFCVADADGSLICTWYGSSKIKIGPDADYDYSYFQGSLTNEDYDAAAISGIQILEEAPTSGQLEDSDESDNPYLIVGNPIILNHPLNTGVSMTEDSNSGELVYTPYGKWRMGLLLRFNLLKEFTPFRVTIPESLDVAVGNTVEITDVNGNTFESHLMSLTWKGHRMILECTGSRTRANANAPSTLTNKQLMDHADQTAKKEAQKAVSSVSAESPDHPGCYCRTVDGETEWINPPMEPGVEYRTTGRYQGKVVYTKLVVFDALPNASTGVKPFGVTSGAAVVRWSGTLRVGSQAASFPWISSKGEIRAIAYISSTGHLCVVTFSDQSANTAEFIVEYIKS